MEEVFSKFTQNGDLNKLKKESSAILKKYNKPVNFDRLAGAQVAVDNLKQEIGQNINQLVAQQDDLSQLEGQTDMLKEGASKFEKNSKSVERQMFWKKIKYGAAIVAIVIVIIVIIILIIKL